MIPQPLHPAVVHFPIVLALLLPVVAIIALIMIRRGADHEEAAEVFLALTLVTTLLVTTGLWGGRVGDLARPVATAATVLLVGLAFQVGHTGGELVYGHGAASAYATRTDGYRPESDDSPRHRDES
jgi:hypothetical protein